MSDDSSPVFEKGYPNYGAVNRESYHDYMGRRMREEVVDNNGRAYTKHNVESVLEYFRDDYTMTEESEKEKVSPYGGLGAPAKTMNLAKLMEMEIKTLNDSYYASLNRIKELVEENQQLKTQIEELKK